MTSINQFYFAGYVVIISYYKSDVLSGKLREKTIV
jgi:hypothetical protein